MNHVLAEYAQPLPPLSQRVPPPQDDKTAKELASRVVAVPTAEEPKEPPLQVDPVPVVQVRGPAMCLCSQVSAQVW